MRILVIGGTRFIGRAVVERLYRDGHTVAVLNRGQTSATLPEAILRITGDINDLPAVRQEIAGFAPDVVLHNIVIHAGHAQALMDVCTDLAGRVVMVSSMDVYRAYGRLIGTEPGPPILRVADEDAPLRENWYPYRDRFPDADHPLFDYDKIPAEQIVLGSASLPGTVLRLPMVIGPNDYQHRLYGYIKPMLDGRPALVWAAGYAQWRSTYGFVDDVAQAIALACTDERASGRVYNVGRAAYTIEQMAAMVKRVLGWDGEFVMLPANKLPEALRPDMDTRHHLVASTARIRTELGFAEEVSLEDAIERTVAWERDNPPDPIPADMFNYAAEDEVLAALER